MKFLIVDDSNLSRQKLRGMITELGYEVVGEACDGLEAIKAQLQLDVAAARLVG